MTSSEIYSKEQISNLIMRLFLTQNKQIEEKILKIRID